MTTYRITNIKQQEDHYAPDEMFREFTYDFFKDGKKINFHYFEVMGPVELKDIRRAMEYMKKVDKSFHCMDCDINTGEINEYYMLKDSVWSLIVPLQDGMLCIGCVENRLGRVLTKDDFTRYPVNLDFGKKSDRLLNRLGRK